MAYCVQHHGAVQVTATFGIDLYRLGTGGRYPFGVIGGLQVSFYHSHAEFAFKVSQRAFKQSGFTRTRRADKIKYQKVALCKQGA